MATERTNYRIELIPIPQDKGGGYEAVIPQLGRYAFRGDGNTPEEALTNLKVVMEYLFVKYREEGFDIPEPEEQSFSGKLSLRIPTSLHARLTDEARRNDTSVNQYIVYVLSSGVEQRANREILAAVENKIDRLAASLGCQISYLGKVVEKERLWTGIGKYAEAA